MLRKSILICLLIGASLARQEEPKDQSAEGAQNNVKRDAPVLSTSYGPPADTEESAAPVYGPPAPAHSHHKTPQSYSKSIPAAAIRNVETVAVTKTITPVVTKTTTYNTHSEPALSIGHVQGYSQSSMGQPKIAPVQFQTQYTSYMNPTVGVNGPVTYTGPAVALAGGGYAVPVSFSALGGSGSGAPVYGPPSESSSAPSSGYGAPGQSPGNPLGSYSMQVPQYLALRQAALQQVLQMQRLQPPSSQKELQQLGVASANYPVSIRAAPSSPYAIYQQPSPVAAASRQHQHFYHHQPQQYLHPSFAQHHQHQRHHHHQQIAQPSQPIQFVQTYAAPSISFTRLQPVHTLQQQQQLHHHPQFHQQLQQQQQLHSQSQFTKPRQQQQQ